MAAAAAAAAVIIMGTWFDGASLPHVAHAES
jgi:hypothetical protein